MRTVALGVVVPLLLLAPGALNAGEAPVRAFGVVGRVVGEGADTPPFWHEYERVSAAADRARYDALKRSRDAYDRALAIYLAPRFADMAFVEGALADTRFVEHATGCIIHNQTIGSLAYEVIRERSEATVPPSARYDKPRRIALARAILGSLALVHLHADAGAELGDLLGLDRNGEGCGAFEKLTAGRPAAFDAGHLARLLTVVDLPWRESDARGEAARLLRGYVIACAIARPDVSDDAKTCLIDTAYARAPAIDGRRFHDASVRARLSPALEAYERQRYETFQKWRPLVADLNAISTAAEMHRRVADIRRLFSVDDPMLLADVLSFDTSELHDSAALRKSKAEAVLRLVRACRDRGGLYCSYALAQARLYVMDALEYARGLKSPGAQRLGFPAREYDELRRLLEINS